MKCIALSQENCKFYTNCYFSPLMFQFFSQIFFFHKNLFESANSIFYNELASCQNLFEIHWAYRIIVEVKKTEFFHQISLHFNVIIGFIRKSNSLNKHTLRKKINHCVYILLSFFYRPIFPSTNFYCIESRNKANSHVQKKNA